ncbi:Putative polysaccharide biosynthesis protein with aminopeptidase-like domain protein [Candidatus Magnetaquicoccaceae bacterium FCR-1]|uniref:Polysaccharide biosynthesis protein with aminopeptidase-like domain protein n=1 Tax=Candidatus Magnetaquiglobus chichijimensis TaxID=3141448 RepID=A0ABQ0C667_9PROT
MYALMQRLFPIYRSLTGNGVRETLRILGERIPIQHLEVPSGTQVFDWTIPQEWNIRDAYIATADGTRVVDFRQNTLHVVGYSQPVDGWFTLEQLQPHLYSLEKQPDAIPYVTSYYSPRWGFCLTHRQREGLQPGTYRVVIDSALSAGSLTYGELLLPGESSREIFLSTNICHPSMANNELSGPVILTELAQWLMSRPRRYSYRLIFIPETIGSLTYLSRNLAVMQERVIAGFTLSCLGDERLYSCVSSPYADTLADRIARHVLAHQEGETRIHSFLERGSDERQYCSPGVDLPVVALCRSRFGNYPEYHTSLDNLDLVTPAGLTGGYRYVQRCIEGLETNRLYQSTRIGEPQLGKYGLYPTLHLKQNQFSMPTVRNLLVYANGRNDLLSIAERIGEPIWNVHAWARRLLELGLLREITPDV